MRDYDCLDKWLIVEGLYRDGEEEIAKYAYNSVEYAKSVIKGRFKAGEEALKELHGGYGGVYWDDYVEFLRKKGIEI